MQQQADAGGEVLDFRPGADMTWEIVRTDDAFKTINTVGAGTGGPPLHLHPQAEESYEVLEGKAEVFVHDEWRTLEPGDKAVVPPGVPHTVRALADTGAIVVNIHRPALTPHATPLLGSRQKQPWRPATAWTRSGVANDQVGASAWRQER